MRATLDEYIDIYFNELRMYTKPTIVVEGPTDKILFNFLTKDIIITCPRERGLNRKRVVIKVLEQICTPSFRKKNNYIGIVDSDFNYILKTRRIDIKNLFYTDYHDIDTLLFLSEAFNKVIKALYWEPIYDNDIEKVRRKCIEIAQEFGYYLLSLYINDIHSTDLKKEFPHIEDYINMKNLKFEHYKAVKKLKDLTKSGKLSRTDLNKIRRQLVNSKSKIIPIYHLVNGHDLICIFSLLTLNKELKLVKRNLLLYTNVPNSLRAIINDISDSLRISYDLTLFKQSDLFHKIEQFQQKVGVVFIQ